MESTLSQSTQDYLKNIFELTSDGQPASTNDLASRLGFKPASVTNMVQKMASAQPPLVAYQKHQGVTLTPEGEHAALEVLRHHRLIESWLVQSLGYTWDEVHEEACRLEHVISEDFEARIAAALGNPTRDPHGDPIPNEDLVMPEEELTPLSALRAPQRATVKRVVGEKAAFLRHLNEIGLVPGARLKVQAFSRFDNNLTVSINKQPPVVLGLAITSKVYVETFKT